MKENRPELLCCPNIPKPLHGLNPRTVLGKEWWDVKRQEAYASTDYCCAACGVPKALALKHQWLEAHEVYDIDYAKGKAVLREIVPLCHYCHSFIHSGRLGMLVSSGKLSKSEAKKILKRGFCVLRKTKFDANYTAMHLYSALHPELNLDWKVDSFRRKQEPRKIQQDWSKWHLQINGKNYFSKFKSEEDWENYKW